MVKAKTSQNGPTRMISYENKTGFFFTFLLKTHYLPGYYFMEPDLNSGIIFMTGLVWLASYVKQLSVPGFFFYLLIPPGYDASLLPTFRYDRRCISDYIACPNLSGCSVVIYLGHNI